MALGCQGKFKIFIEIELTGRTGLRIVASSACDELASLTQHTYLCGDLLR